MDKIELKGVLESLLFASQKPLTLAEIRKILRDVYKEKTIFSPVLPVENKSADLETVSLPLPENEEEEVLAQLLKVQKKMEDDSQNNVPSVHELKNVITEIEGEYAGRTDRGFELAFVAGGFQFRTKPDFSPYLKNLNQSSKTRLSSPAMETLAIVAYQQPVGRSRVEEIRGVDSGGVLKTLLDRDFIRIVGKSEEAGRPLLYGTTSFFLETFSLSSLSDLPTLKDLEALEGTPTEGGLETKEGPPQEALPQEALPQEALSQDETPWISEGEEGYFNSDDSSRHLISDLENSLEAIKDLEARIFPKSERPVS